MHWRAQMAQKRLGVTNLTLGSFIHLLATENKHKRQNKRLQEPKYTFFMYAVKDKYTFYKSQ